MLSNIIISVFRLPQQWSTLIVLCSLWVPGIVFAETWVQLPYSSSGIDAATVNTFAGLMRTEISRAGSVTLVKADHCPAEDIACGRTFSVSHNAEGVLAGRLGKLGKKIIVSVQLYAPGSGKVLNSQKMTVDAIEDLEEASTRLAEALVGNTSTDAVARLGSITQKEVKPARVREGRVSAAFRMGGASQVGGVGASSDGALLIDLASFYETNKFAIELRTGVRWVPDHDEFRSTTVVPFDIGVFYLPSLGDITPIVGGGAGIHYLVDRRPGVNVTGSNNFSATTVSSEVNENSTWAPAIFARAGALFMRTYSWHVSVMAEYNVNFAELNGESSIQTVDFSVGVIW